ncbi:MAG: [protein-PII] uridylyltransferase [Deltaproteobacteria bacterium]|nr:[protein-PII] uridylyltransferase [Deltaproteobacteria bacterium]
MRKKVLETIESAGKSCLDKLKPQGSDNIKIVKNYLSICMEGIKAVHDAGGAGLEVLALRTIVIDRLLVSLFDLAGKEYCLKYRKVDQKCTLVALGGYGRGELSPVSDIDIMFLYPWKVGSYVESVIERVLYILWDTGLDVGYSTRSISECVKISSEIVAKTSLVDSRYICGDKALYNDYLKTLKNQIFSNGADSFIKEKINEGEERRKKYGDSVYILEPDIKEGNGGLRDLHTALWAAKVKYKVADFKELKIKGIINDREYDEVLSAFDFMSRVRNDLHFIVNRKSDQLTFQLQEKIALNLGYKGEGEVLPVEQLMKDYYLAANTIKEYSEIFIERSLSQYSSKGVGAFLSQRELSDGFKLFRGEITIAHKNFFRKHPPAIMRLFEVSQIHGAEIHSFARDCLRAGLDLIDDDFRNSQEVNRSFMNILKSEWDVAGTMKVMHKLEVLNRYIPEFGEVNCLVQHDMYHIYTVDVHSLFAVAELRKLTRGVYEDKYPIRTMLMEELEKPEVLYLAAFLHDIGKGKGGKHEIIGAEISVNIARRIGFSEKDVRDIEFLVLNHLRLSHTAQRRDLNDPKLILDFAREMGSLERLKMLYLLTYADIKAIGPDVWNEWKSSLFLELYTKTAEVFEKGTFELEETKVKVDEIEKDVEGILGDEFPGKVVKDFMDSMPERYLLSTTPESIASHFRIALKHEDPLALDVKHKEKRGYSRIIITTIDAPGLFSKICGVLSANSINILGAQIYTRSSGEVIDIFQVRSAIDGAVTDSRRWDKVKSDLIDVIKGKVKVEKLVEKKSKPSILGGKYKPSIKPGVFIDNKISDTNTVIEIFAQDRIGLLYTISSTLLKEGLYIDVSKISTMGEQVTDVFYVKDIFGQKVFYEKKLHEVKEALLKAIEEG